MKCATKDCYYDAVHRSSWCAGHQPRLTSEDEKSMRIDRAVGAWVFIILVGIFWIGFGIWFADHVGRPHDHVATSQNR